MMGVLQNEVLKQIKQFFELLEAKKFKIFDVNALNDVLLNHKY